MKTLTQFVQQSRNIIEGFASGGFAYEQRIQDILNDAGIGVEGKKTAGSGHGADAYMSDSKGKTYGVEVKMSPNVFAGQKNCKYDSSSGDWSWTNPDDLTAFYDEVGLVDMILSKVSGKLHAQMKILGTKRLPFTMSNLEYSLFRRSHPEYSPELGKFDMTPQAIYKNYTQKGVNYIQLGEGYGLYYLAADPLNLAKVGVPQFKPSAVKVRTRLKWGGSTFEPSEIESVKGTSKASKTSQVAFNNGLILAGLERSPINLEDEAGIRVVRRALSGGKESK